MSEVKLQPVLCVPAVKISEVTPKVLVTVRP